MREHHDTARRRAIRRFLRVGVGAAAALLLSAGAAAWAATGSSYGGGFPQLEPSARDAGLAGVGTALARGPSSVFTNPAGLVYAVRPELSVSNADLFGLGLVSHTVVGFDLPRPRHRVRWEEGKIRHEVDQVPAQRAWGVGFSGLRADAGEETYRESQFAAGYAQEFPGDLRAGATVRWLKAQSGLAGTGGSGWAFDFGAIRPLGEFRLGFTASAIASNLSWNAESGATEESAPLPERFSLALAWLPATLPLAATVQGDWVSTDLHRRQAGAAVEWSAIGPLVLRAGLRRREDAAGSRLDWGAGAGARVGRIVVDYGLLHNARDLGDTHRVSAAFVL